MIGQLNEKFYVALVILIRTISFSSDSLSFYLIVLLLFFSRWEFLCLYFHTLACQFTTSE